MYKFNRLVLNMGLIAPFGVDTASELYIIWHKLNFHD